MIGGHAPIVIVGAGMAGYTLAREFRRLDKKTPLTLVTSDEGCLYSKPMLSNAFFLGKSLAGLSTSSALLAAWERKPITFKRGNTAAGVERSDAGYIVVLSNGERIEADCVLSAAGLRPVLGLARDAGIATGQGILVNRFGFTSAEHVHAIGNCAQYIVGNHSAVLPYVAPMLTAARAMARTLSGTLTEISLGREAVIVKTPSCRLALLPPGPGSGTWRVDRDGEQIVARCVDDSGLVHGFALSRYKPDSLQRLRAEVDRSSIGVN